MEDFASFFTTFLEKQKKKTAYHTRKSQSHIIATLKTQIAHLTSLNSSLTSEVNSLKIQLNTKQVKINELESKLIDAENKINTLTSQLSDKQKQVQESDLKLNFSQEKNIYLQKIIDNTENMIAQQITQVQEKTTKLIEVEIEKIVPLLVHTIYKEYGDAEQIADKIIEKYSPTGIYDGTLTDKIIWIQRYFTTTSKTVPNPFSPKKPPINDSGPSRSKFKLVIEEE